jgi:hypothetical protein
MLAAYIACQKCYYGAASFLHPIVSLHIYSFGGKLLIEVALNVKMAKKSTVSMLNTMEDFFL